MSLMLQNFFLLAADSKSADVWHFSAWPAEEIWDFRKRRFFSDNEKYDPFLVIGLTVTRPSANHYLTALIGTVSFLRNWPKLKRHTQNVSEAT